VENPLAVVLWVEILWLKYTELTPEVREQLEIITKEIAQNEREEDLGTSQSRIDKYLSNTKSELGKAEGELKQHATGPTHPDVVALKKKVRDLQQAHRALDAIGRVKTL